MTHYITPRERWVKRASLGPDDVNQDVSLFTMARDLADGIDFDESPYEDLLEETTIFTPDFAEYLLDNHRGPNRSLPLAAAERYASDMRQGAFPYIGGAITFDSDLLLLDGQTRLEACVKSGKPFMARMIVGFDREMVLHAYDKGVKRTRGHNLGIAGYKHPAAMGSASAWLLSICDRDNWWFPPRAVWTQQIIDKVMAEHYDGLLAMHDHMVKHRAFRLLSAKGPFMALSYLMSICYPGETEMFLYRFGEGVDVEQGDAIYMLRRKLEDNQAATRAQRARHSSDPTTIFPIPDRFAYILKSWHLWMNGETVKTLLLRKTTEHPEQFPDIPLPNDWRLLSE